jgi:molybdenum cofactor biosynthesis enzyme MoaA
MKIQSLSIDVPASCPNDCRFCVAHMHREDYINHIEDNHRFRHLYKDDYKKRLLFAKDNGCNTIVLTGNGEPLANRNFLQNFAEWNSNLPDPFYWIELQTSGVLLDDEYLRFLRNEIGVSTISLSLSSIFNSDKNAEYNQTPQKLKVDIDEICSEIKRYDFNLRLSLNMTDVYNNVPVKEIFNRAKELKADQITFRELYISNKNSNCKQNKWIKKHRCNPEKIVEIEKYIEDNGIELQILPFGAIKYSVHNISTVLDIDCMSTQVKDVVKYLILRPNGKLYSSWADKGSLIF